MSSFGIVIDASMMNKIFTALLSFLITIVPIILTLYQPSSDGAIVCELSAQETLSIQAAMASRNHTCNYNMTLGDVLRL